jgi:acyl-CoA hydrolase
VGELITFLSSVNFTGKTSMEVGVKVLAENIITREVRHVNSCFFTMIAVDDDRKPIVIQTFIPQTEDELRRHESAKIRKELRQEFSVKHDLLKKKRRLKAEAMPFDPGTLGIRV